MEEIRIRKATFNDIETLRRFEQGVINTERPFDVTLKKGDIFYYDIEGMIESSHIELLVAELNDQLIGCGYSRIEKAKHYLQHPQHAYLGFMYVEPAYRGKGINKKIIDALKKWSLSQSIMEMRLDVYHDNSSAINAYEKAGFTKHMIEMRMGTK
jgi:ribosomal protein S18 acetylase RimI-like enzyme